MTELSPVEAALPYETSKHACCLTRCNDHLNKPRLVGLKNCNFQMPLFAVKKCICDLKSHSCDITHTEDAQLKTFIHLVVCLTTGPKPLPNRALHIVRSRASSFKCDYPLLSLRSSGSFLRFLPRLPVTSIPPFIFPSITRCRRQFLRRM